MRRQTKRRRDRIVTAPNRALAGFLVATLYCAALCLLAAFPASCALAIFRIYGTNVGGNIRLAFTGTVLLYALLALMFVGSIAIRGLGKAVLKSHHVGWLWLVVMGIVIAVGLAIFTVQINAAISGVHPGPLNSNGDILAFFGVWLLTVGHAATAAGNETVERLAQWAESWIGS